MPARPIATFLCCSAAVIAQAPYQGNGVGQAYFGHTMARIGGTFDAAFGSPAAPGGLAIMGFSDGLGPTTFPLIGVVGLDLMSPMFSALTFALDAAGGATLIAPIPNTPALAQMVPIFAVVAVLEPTQISVSKTTRVAWENADSWSPGSPLRTARAGHTATPLGFGPFDPETRLLITGGGGGTILVPQATRSTELYSALTRAPVAGPSLAVERALHQAVLLPNGRVLVCGGTDSAGIVTATAELYDPIANQFVATGSMRQPRAGHAATVLANGKVLVTGGLATYVNPLGNLAAVLNTAQDTGELFDPATGQWSSVPGTMSSRRSGHTQTLLPDGRVLICAGIRGGMTTTTGIDIPVFTAFCSTYDPATNSFAPAASMTEARAFHGASVLANGDVLVTGGSIANPLFGIVGATATCERWNGTSFQTVAPLLVPVTNHVQLRAEDGRAIILGGLTGLFPSLVGSADTGRHDGTSFFAGRNIGENPGIPGAQPAPRGAMTATLLFDGSIALHGGTDGIAPLSSTLVYRQ